MLGDFMEKVVNPILAVANNKIQEELKEEAASHLLRVQFVKFLPEVERCNILYLYFISNAENKPVAQIIHKIEWNLREFVTWGRGEFLSPSQLFVLNGILEGITVPLVRRFQQAPFDAANLDDVLSHFSNSIKSVGIVVKDFVETAGQALADFSLMRVLEANQQQSFYSFWFLNFFQSLKDGIESILKERGVMVEGVEISDLYGVFFESFLHPTFLFAYSQSIPDFGWDIIITFHHPRFGRMRIAIPIEVSTEHLYRDENVKCNFKGIFLSSLDTFISGVNFGFHLFHPVLQSFKGGFEGYVHSTLPEERDPVVFGKKVANRIVEGLLEAFPPSSGQKPKAFFDASEVDSEEVKSLLATYYQTLKFSFKVAYGVCAILKVWLARVCKVPPANIELEVVPRFESGSEILRFHASLGEYFYAYIRVKPHKGEDDRVLHFLNLLSAGDSTNPNTEPSLHFTIMCRLTFYFDTVRNLQQLIARNNPLPCEFIYEVENDDDLPTVFKGKFEITDTPESIKQCLRNVWEELEKKRGG